MGATSLERLVTWQELDVEVRTGFAYAKRLRKLVENGRTTPTLDEEIRVAITELLEHALAAQKIAVDLGVWTRVQRSVQGLSETFANLTALHLIYVNLREDQPATVIELTNERHSVRRVGALFVHRVEHRHGEAWVLANQRLIK